MLTQTAVVTALLLLITLKGTRASKEKTTIHSSARDFYHNLSIEKQQKLLLNAKLQDPSEVDALHRLLSSKSFAISEIYNNICNQLDEGRAKEILHLSKDRKDLEMLLLGPACLSKEIIKARKSLPNMWPPTGFPLIVKGFEPFGVGNNHVTDILDGALKEPESWQSLKWISTIKWKKMTMLHFWRMIPPRCYLYWQDLHPYIWRALFQPGEHAHQDLEVLLMKSIRIPYFDDNWERFLELENPNLNTLLDNFSHLKDPWSIKVLALLGEMYSKGWKKWNFPKALVESGLVQFASWKDLFDQKTIDKRTATNDILELLTVAIDTPTLDDYKEAINQASILFANEMIDWSSVRPLVIGQVVKALAGKSDNNTLLVKNVDKMLESPNALFVLPSWLLAHSANMDAHKHNTKITTPSLVDTFSESTRKKSHLSSYIDLLYLEWKCNKNKWPGIFNAHKNASANIRQVFKPSESEEGTWDPKVDQKYNSKAWRLAFQSIRFDVDHGIPSTLVPSICFLKVLLYARNYGHLFRYWDWNTIKVGEDCVLPKSKTRRAYYMDALTEALVHLFEFPSLPTASAELLQSRIRGECPA